MNIPEITVGCSNSCDVYLRHSSALRTDTVSRRHLLLKSAPEPGMYHLTDLNSSNGTYVQCEGKWIRIRTAVVGLYNKLRLGAFETTVAALINAWEQRQYQSPDTPSPRG